MRARDWLAVGFSLLFAGIIAGVGVLALVGIPWAGWNLPTSAFECALVLLLFFGTAGMVAGVTDGDGDADFEELHVPALRRFVNNVASLIMVVCGLLSLAGFLTAGVTWLWS